MNHLRSVRPAKTTIDSRLAAILAFSISIGNAPAQAAAATSAAELPSIWPTLLALLAVIAAIVIFGWLMKKLNPATTRSGQLLRQISQLPVGPKERVVVVSFQSQWLVLGVTAQSIQLLSTTNAPPADITAIQVAPTLSPAASFSHLLNSALGRKPADNTASREQPGSPQ